MGVSRTRNERKPEGSRRRPRDSVETRRARTIRRQKHRSAMTRNRSTCRRRNGSRRFRRTRSRPSGACICRPSTSSSTTSPLALVRQRVTKPGLPHVDRAPARDGGLPLLDKGPARRASLSPGQPV